MLISKFDNTGIEKNIKDFELHYEFQFPEEYKEFLVKYNGGRTPNTEFQISKINSDIDGFYGLGNADEEYNYSVFEKDKTIMEYLEDKVIPIGSNIFGDSIVIGTDGDNRGKIYFLYHDTPKKYIALSESFKLFVKEAKSQKVGHIRTIEERKRGMIENGLGDKITPASIKGWQAEIDYYSDIHQEELVLD